MPDWLQILLTIVLTLGIIAVLVVVGFKIYHNLSRPGKCVFISYSPAGQNSGYVQTGYVSCSGGGSAWKPTKLNIFNQGPGDFYIGPISGQSDPGKIPAGQYYTYSILTGTEPNIYYAAGSQYTTPNFSINYI